MTSCCPLFLYLDRCISPVSYFHCSTMAPRATTFIHSIKFKSQFIRCKHIHTRTYWMKQIWSRSHPRLNKLYIIFLFWITIYYAVAVRRAEFAVFWVMFWLIVFFAPSLYLWFATIRSHAFARSKWTPLEPEQMSVLVRTYIIPCIFAHKYMQHTTRNKCHPFAKCMEH